MLYLTYFYRFSPGYFKKTLKISISFHPCAVHKYVKFLLNGNVGFFRFKTKDAKNFTAEGKLNESQQIWLPASFSFYWHVLNKQKGQQILKPGKREKGDAFLTRKEPEVTREVKCFFSWFVIVGLGFCCCMQEKLLESGERIFYDPTFAFIIYRESFYGFVLTWHLFWNTLYTVLQ